MFCAIKIVINHLISLRYDLRIDPFEVSSAVQPNVNIVHPFTDASR